MLNVKPSGSKWIPLPLISENNPAQQKITSAVMGALRSIHSATSPSSMEPKDLERQRKGQELLGKLISPMGGLCWEPFSIGQIPCAWVRPEQGHNPYKAILYCHGGGYTSGDLNYSRLLASKLAHATGYSVLCFAYRLAPEFQYPAPLEDAKKVWEYLMQQGYGARDIVLLGDSAGGNLALTLTLWLRQQNRFVPGRLVLLSPWTDMTCSGESYQQYKDTDPMITEEYMHAVRNAYAPNGNWQDPFLSPVNANFEGFPPVLIQVGSNEVLFSDSASLHHNLIEQGIPCRMECWEGMWHVFQTFPIPRADKAVESIARFLWDNF